MNRSHKFHRASIALFFSLAFGGCRESEVERMEKLQKAVETKKAAILEPYADVLGFDAENGPFSAPLTITQQDEIANNPKRVYWIEDVPASGNLDVYREQDGVRIAWHRLHAVLIHCDESNIQEVLRAMQSGRATAKVLIVFTLKSVSPAGGNAHTGSALQAAADGSQKRLFEGELIKAAVIDEGEVLDGSK